MEVQNPAPRRRGGSVRTTTTMIRSATMRLRVSLANAKAAAADAAAAAGREARRLRSGCPASEATADATSPAQGCARWGVRAAGSGLDRADAVGSSWMRPPPQRAYGTMRAVCASSSSGMPAASVGTTATKVVPFPLAQTGEGIAECEIVQWHVQVGDRIEPFQPVCEVQSDKANIEITSRHEGIVKAVCFAPGDVAAVGATLIEVEVAVEEDDDADADAETPPPVHAAPEVEAAEATLPTPPASDPIVETKTLASPAVRRLAKEHGIALASVQGSGAGGRVLKGDLLPLIEGHASSASREGSPAPPTLAASPASFAAPLQALSAAPADREEPIRGFMRTMFRSMTASLTVPHFHYNEEFNMQRLEHLRRELKPDFASDGLKLTSMPFLIKALSLAMAEYPIVNSSITTIRNETGEDYVLRYHGSHNVGFAVATDHGLVVPNIKDVQSLSVYEVRLTQERRNRTNPRARAAFAINSLPRTTHPPTPLPLPLPHPQEEGEERGEQLGEGRNA